LHGYWPKKRSINLWAGGGKGGGKTGQDMWRRVRKKERGDISIDLIGAREVITYRIGDRQESDGRRTKDEAHQWKDTRDGVPKGARSRCWPEGERDQGRRKKGGGARPKTPKNHLQSVKRRETVPGGRIANCFSPRGVRRLWDRNLPDFRGKGKEPQGKPVSQDVGKSRTRRGDGEFSQVSRRRSLDEKRGGTLKEEEG